MKPILYVTVGIPGSGKTTYCNTKLPKINHVSRDKIRFNMLEPDMEYFDMEDKVFEYWTDRIANDLKNGKNVIADATHLNTISRNKLVRALENKGVLTRDYNIIFICFDIPLSVCLKRNNTRKGRALVPERTLSNMFRNLEFPKINEFHNILEIWRVID